MKPAPPVSKMRLGFPVTRHSPGLQKRTRQRNSKSQCRIASLAWRTLQLAGVDANAFEPCLNRTPQAKACATIHPGSHTDSSACGGRLRGSSMAGVPQPQPRRLKPAPQKDSTWLRLHKKILQNEVFFTKEGLAVRHMFCHD